MRTEQKKTVGVFYDGLAHVTASVVWYEVARETASVVVWTGTEKLLV